LPGSRWLVIAPPYLWMLLFFAIPSRSRSRSASRTSWWRCRRTRRCGPWDGKDLDVKLNLGNYLFLLTDSLYYAAYLSSLKIALVSTLLCLLIGYPIAYAIARMPPATRNFALMLVILPSWTSFLIRIYAWIGILKNNGLLNNFLIWTGLIDEPLQILHTNVAVYIGIVYAYLPFMVLPLYTNLVKLDLRLLEAAYDLGARPWKVFLTITLPLSRAGIIAGSMLVAIPVVGEFVIPELLGGPVHADDRQGAVGRVLQQPRLAGGLGGVDGDAAAVAGADHGLPPLRAEGNGAPADVSARSGTSPLLKAMLVLGFVFLYAPILSLIVYSFNESRLVTVWAGFSVKWYGELFRDQGIIDAAWVSIRIAFFTACASVVLATVAALVMTRFRQFRGKLLFGALMTAPLVMPR
jgi:putrescine transport system permease protein